MKQKHIDKISNKEIIDIYNNYNLTLHESAAKLNLTVITLWRRAKALDLKWSNKNIQLDEK